GRTTAPPRTPPAPPGARPSSGTAGGPRPSPATPRGPRARPRPRPAPSACRRGPSPPAGRRAARGCGRRGVGNGGGSWRWGSEARDRSAQRAVLGEGGKALAEVRRQGGLQLEDLVAARVAQVQAVGVQGLALEQRLVGFGGEAGDEVGQAEAVAAAV